jgi:hypothetical protein
MKSRGIAYWCLCGLWCSAGAFAVGVLLAYLTNWPIGAVTGTITGVVLAFGLLSKSAAETDNDEELDLSERLRKSLVYSRVRGNRYHTE